MPLEVRKALIMKILPKIDTASQTRDKAKEKLIRKEAEYGGKLFGPVPKNHQRQFFCLDEHTWVWHESWTDKSGERHIVTTRYDVRPNGVYKVQNNSSYQSLSNNEIKNLYQAAEAYYNKFSAEYLPAV
jgi:hypothetical protein